MARYPREVAVYTLASKAPTSSNTYVCVHVWVLAYTNTCLLPNALMPTFKAQTALPALVPPPDSHTHHINATPAAVCKQTSIHGAQSIWWIFQQNGGWPDTKSPWRSSFEHLLCRGKGRRLPAVVGYLPQWSRCGLPEAGDQGVGYLRGWSGRGLLAPVIRAWAACAGDLVVGYLSHVIHLWATWGRWPCRGLPSEGRCSGIGRGEVKVVFA